MRASLPPDFDANWYEANYRDVALSGLSPKQHYLRFGRLLGRKVSASKAPPAAATKVGKAKQRSEAPVARMIARQEQPRPNTPAPIIDRPEGFDPAETVPRAAAPRPGGNATATIGLEEIAVGGAAAQAALGPALQAYARLLRLPAAVDANARVSCEAAAFQAGPVRVDNAWLIDNLGLRLMLTGGADASGALSVRAYQAEPDRPGDLRLLGEGIELPQVGPVFHDVELLHPLMPVLLEVAEADGTTRAIALMPFPSLLPGGLHSAELRALQDEPNPIDAFWSLSELLLQETIGGDGWADRSVIGVTVNGGDGFPQPVRDWLSAVFGISADQTVGQQLQLPPQSVPTIGALTSRRLSGDTEGFASGPYLVAEARGYRPRWSITLPADLQPNAAVPQLRAAGVASDALPTGVLAPIHLGIVLRSSHAPTAARADPAAATVPPIPANVSVVLSGSDAERLETLVQSIRAAVSGEVEFILRTPNPSDELAAVLDGACDGQGWVQARAGAELREIAGGVRHGTLLTVSERVGLDGPTLSALLDLLRSEETAGSASCALLSEKIIKKKAVLQPASGGLFPAGVSFASAPRLSFGEPDALQALPDLAYPVVANTLWLTVWRSGALAALPRSAGPTPAGAEDIRLGLDLMQAGYRNWCTTKVSARIAGPYVPRDMIDPVGAAYLQPERWEDLLGRVAVIRELF